jgi:hypothetical protein
MKAKDIIINKDYIRKLKLFPQKFFDGDKVYHIPSGTVVYLYNSPYKDSFNYKSFRFRDESGQVWGEVVTEEGKLEPADVNPIVLSGENVVLLKEKGLL